jgi:two-component system, cell cycle sensor histidine kinase and response regulator CckA
VSERAVRLLFVGSRKEATSLSCLLQHAMGRAAIRIEHVSTFEEAQEQLDQAPYDLLLLDDEIGGLSSLDLLRELRRSHRSLFLVFLSRSMDEAAILDALRAGADDLLPKSSVSQAKLYQTIRGALCHRKQEDERSRAEDQLRKLSRAVEQSADLVVITDRAGAIEYVNPAFCDLTGYQRDEVLGRTPRILKSDQQNPAFYAELWSTILSGRVFRGVLVNRKKNGELFYLEKTITPVRDAQGVITHFISSDRDITERHKLQDQLLQAQKMDAIGQLAGGVAHDFNNLLMVISSYAELALDQLPPEHGLRRNVDEILNASRRAADLTRQLLAFGRKQMQSLQVVDLNGVLQELARMLPRLISEDIHLSIVPGKNLGRVKADPVQLEQIIMNLAVNARDAMPDGGTLTIETSNADLDEEYIHRRPIVPAGRYVLLTVSDCGKGIAAKDLPHIFEPFFTTKESGKGTGLGLATVYGIVKQSGGYVWVYSEPGQGTTFKIYLPRLASRSTREAGAVHSAPSYAKGSETLLLVEDEAVVRRAMSEFLRGCGYTVLEATDGQQAIEQARQHSGAIHLAVTDVVMPNMSGSQLADELSRVRPETKVLYVSGYAHGMLEKHGLDARTTQLLQKPFTLTALAAKVRYALERENAALAPSTPVS